MDGGFPASDPSQLGSNSINSWEKYGIAPIGSNPAGTDRGLRQSCAGHLPYAAVWGPAAARLASGGYSASRN